MAETKDTGAPAPGQESKPAETAAPAAQVEAQPSTSSPPAMSSPRSTYQFGLGLDPEDELDELDDASREIAQHELADKIFNPKITRIVSHKREFGVTTLHAQTDRGRVEFQFHGQDDIRILSPTRALFRDVDGNTLELPDIDQLDPVSRKYISRYF